jgi:hypothetical protein
MKLGLALLSVGVLSSAAAADVLFDNLYITDNQLYSLGNGANIGGYAVFGVDYDLQLGDDFTVPAGPGYLITDVTADFIGFNQGGPSYALVEIFQNVGGHPSEAPLFHGLFGPDTTPFNDWMGYIGKRMHADVSGGGFALGAGDYFVSFTPVTCAGFGNGDWHYQIVMDDNNPVGATRHIRDGGTDFPHNGYYGFGGFGGGYSTNDWQPATYAGYTNGDMVFKIEGTIVPAPGALALLGLAGLIGRRRR